MNSAVERHLEKSVSDDVSPGQKMTFAFETILSALQSHVVNQPNTIAYTFLKSDNERQTRTYQQLDIRARQIACGLLR
jgi:acyl-CoA synthetase (AMP-forming)/AMP-acid ligase II